MQTLPLTIHVNLGKSLNLSEAHFLLLHEVIVGLNEKDKAPKTQFIKCYYFPSHAEIVHKNCLTIQNITKIHFIWPKSQNGTVLISHIFFHLLC